jgi:hypothetical protein
MPWLQIKIYISIAIGSQFSDTLIQERHCSGQILLSLAEYDKKSSLVYHSNQENTGLLIKQLYG